MEFDYAVEVLSDFAKEKGFDIEELTNDLVDHMENGAPVAVALDFTLSDWTVS